MSGTRCCTLPDSLCNEQWARSNYSEPGSLGCGRSRQIGQRILRRVQLLLQCLEHRFRFVRPGTAVQRLLTQVRATVAAETVVVFEDRARLLEFRIGP